MGFTDGSEFVGHIQAEHPWYTVFCDYANCYRSFIAQSGLYKHVKQVHHNEEQDDKEFTVGCGLCYMEFNSEEACDAHDCAAKKSSKAMVKKEP